MAEETQYKEPVKTPYLDGTIAPKWVPKPKLATLVSFENTGPVYLGVTKDAISDFIKSEGDRKLPGVLKQIGELQSKLEKLYKEKEEIENDINIEITESKKE